MNVSGEGGIETRGERREKRGVVVIRTDSSLFDDGGQYVIIVVVVVVVKWSGCRGREPRVVDFPTPRAQRREYEREGGGR